MCHAAKRQGESLPARNSNCNGRGDDVIARRGPGGLFNQNWTCEDRYNKFKDEGVTYFHTETIFHSPLNMVSTKANYGVRASHVNAARNATTGSSLLSLCGTQHLASSHT